MNILLALVTTISLLALIYFVIRTIISTNKKDAVKRKKYLKLMGISFGIMILGTILIEVTGEPELITQAEKVAVTSQEEPKKEPEVVKEKSKNTISVPTSVKKSEPPVSYASLNAYLDDTLEPLVRSVSSNMDLNWGFYMVEPIERLGADRNLERFKSDVGLLVSLYDGIIKQIDDSPMPNLKDSEKQSAEKVKSELKNSISKRIDVAETLIAKDSAEAVLNTEINKELDVSNDHLLNAVNEYKSLVQ